MGRKLRIGGSIEEVIKLSVTPEKEEEKPVQKKN